MRDVRNARNVEHVQPRIAQRLAEHEPRIRAARARPFWDLAGRPGVTGVSGVVPVAGSSMNAAVEFSIALNIHPTSSHS
jgi:hypothetical protein